MTAGEGVFRIPPGARLNGIYKVEHLIAVGGMGEVYAGRAVETGVPVAIKMIRPELAADPAIIGLFRREALALHQLRHEAIVAYYVFSIDPDLNAAYLAMEFVPGRALSDLAREGPLGFDFVHTLQRRVASGLQAAHQLGVIHRDVSSDNIILPDGDPARAKIIDFGIAKNTLDTSTIIGSGFAGKNNYVSPEQLGMAGGVITAKSDVYSLGLVLVEALLGRPLDMGGNLAEVIAKREGVPDLTGVDQRMKPLIRRMLDPDPERRPSMAEIAAHEPPPIEAVAPPDPTIVKENLSRDATRIKDIVSRRVAQTAPPQPAGRGRTPFILGGSAVAAALLAVGAFLLWPSESPPPRTAASRSAPATIQVQSDPPATAPDPLALARQQEEERRRRDEIAANEQRANEQRAAQERAAREEQERLARAEQDQRRQAEEAQRREAAETQRRRQAEQLAAEQARLAQEREARARQEDVERRRQAEEAEQRRLAQERAEREARARQEQEAERRRQAEATAAAEQQRLAREQAERAEREARVRREQEQEIERRRQAEAAAVADQQRLAREQAERIEREARARQEQENERRRQADAALAEQQRLAQMRAELAEREAAARREQEQENERRRQAEVEAARKPPQVASRADATTPTLPNPNTRDCSQCPDLVAIPEGAMQMGSNRDPSERPVRPIQVKSFLMSRFPVTVAQWRECVRAAACAYDAKGDDNSPVNNVSLDDAQQYIVWLSKVTGRNYRLPTEAEWEYAARGGAKTRYWWGEEFSADFAGCRRCGPSRSAPWPVGNFKPNPFGLYDMTGNVGQWVSDCWHRDYRGAPKDSSSWSAGRCREQVVRGGSWTSEPADQTVTSRSFYDPGVRHPSYGFRVVRSP